MAPVVLGLDGGGTKTACALVNEEGRLLGAALAGPSNLQNEGPASSALAISAAVRGALEAAGIGPDGIAACCLGLGGLDTPRDLETYRAIATEAVGVHDHLRLENDVFIGLASGTWGGPGVAVVAGTGSIAGGRGEDGKRVRAGGWGYLISDEGSAFAAGREAVAAALRAHDGIGPPTALLGALLQRFGVPAVPAMVQAIYAHPRPQALLASIAPLLDDVASRDEEAAAILAGCGRSLARLGLAVARQLSLHPPVAVVAVGGMYSSRFVLDAFMQEITDNLVARICLPACDPVAGALALALRDVGIALTPPLVGRLEGLRLNRETNVINM